MTEQDAIDQLAAILDGTASADDAPTALSGLVTLAHTVRSEREIVAPSADFRDALRAELVAAGAPVPSLTERLRGAWVSRTTNLRTSARMAVATMTASSMLGTAGVAVAAQEAIPGDALYGMKGWTEQVRLMLATDELAEARLQLAFAAERLEELQQGAGTLTSDQIVDLLRRMDEASKAGADAMIDGAAGGESTLDELRAFTDRQRTLLAGLFSDLPATTQTNATRSLDLLRRIDVNATGVVVPVTPTSSVAGDQDTIAPPSRVPGPGPDALDILDTFRTPTDTRSTSGANGDGDSSQADSDTSTDSGDDAGRTQSPFEPTGDLSDPTTDGDDGGDGPVSSTLDQLPLDELNAGVSDVTGQPVDTSAAGRAGQSADETAESETTEPS